MKKADQYSILTMFKDKDFRRHFVIIAAVVFIAAIAVSLAYARLTTVNDMIIRYTEASLEELETEGYEEAYEEETEAVSEDVTEATESIISETVQKINTMHRPSILSDLSDMYRKMTVTQ